MPREAFHDRIVRKERERQEARAIHADSVARKRDQDAARLARLNALFPEYSGTETPEARAARMAAQIARALDARKDVTSAERREWGRRRFWALSGKDASRAEHVRLNRLRPGARQEPYSRKAIFARDGWLCHLCGNPVPPELEHPDPLCASVDHVVPLSRGGDDTAENVACSHLVCNLSKGAGR